MNLCFQCEHYIDTGGDYYYCEIHNNVIHWLKIENDEIDCCEDYIFRFGRQKTDLE